MPISPDPAFSLPATTEAKLLADCYALLLANIRQNRARRLAQSTPDSTVLESVSQVTSLRLGGVDLPIVETPG